MTLGPYSFRIKSNSAFKGLPARPPDLMRLRRRNPLTRAARFSGCPGAEGSRRLGQARADRRADALPRPTAIPLKISFVAVVVDRVAALKPTAGSILSHLISLGSTRCKPLIWLRPIPSHSGYSSTGTRGPAQSRRQIPFRYSATCELSVNPCPFYGMTPLRQRTDQTDLW